MAEKKYEVMDWVKFGALYGFLLGLVYIVGGAFIGGLLGSIFPMSSYPSGVNPSSVPVIGAILGAIVGVGAMIVSIIVGAVEWGLAGLVMPHMKKYVKGMFWCVLASYLFVVLIVDLLTGGINLVLMVFQLLTAVVLTWLTMMVAPYLKLKY